MENILANVLDRKWETARLSEIIQQSPEILEGISSKRAAKLREALDVNSIEELANNKFVRWAQALVAIERQ